MAWGKYRNEISMETSSQDKVQLKLTVSAQISQDHMATAFHFLISNRGAEPTSLQTLEGWPMNE